MKKLALCLHDVRVSDGETTIGRIRTVSERFAAPLTVHLVFDQPLASGSALFAFLREQTTCGQIELVFHGISHRCPPELGRLLAFYHKHEAEYLLDSDELRQQTGQVFADLNSWLGAPPGICPPCWLACRNNLRFFETLSPCYVESLLSLHSKGRRVFSPILSLATPVPAELAVLRPVAQGMSVLSRCLAAPRVRMAVHVCDLEVASSMHLFSGLHERMLQHGFSAVLQRELLG